LSATLWAIAGSKYFQYRIGGPVLRVSAVTTGSTSCSQLAPERFQASSIPPSSQDRAFGQDQAGACGGFDQQLA
jgi:hypothetical protein